MTALKDELRGKAEEAWWLDPHTFAERASGGSWRAARHLSHIGTRIRSAVTRGNGRLVINMPARYGKSEFISRWVPTWFLSLYPDRDVILAAWGSALAVEHGGEVRNIARDNPLVDFRLRPDSTAKARWNTHLGGGMLCVGVGGGVTGFGADLLIIDDPYVDWDDAWSSASRARVERWFDSTAYKRLHPGGSIIVLHTRYHPRDLSGYLVEHHGDTWEHISLPKLAEANDPLGRAPGEALWPAQWSQAHVEHEQQITPKHVWSAMDQQQPEAASAGLAYQNFSAGNVDQNAALVPDLPLCVSFDFNRNPGMHCLVGQYDQKSDRFVITHVLHGHRWTVERILDELKLLVGELGGWQWPGLEVFGDATGGGVSMDDGHNSFVLIRQRCEQLTDNVRIRVPAGNPGVVDSLLSTNDALLDAGSERHVFVHPRCELLLEDLRRVQKDEDGSIDKSNTQLTHPSDCMRYWIDFLRPLGGAIVQPHGLIGSVDGSTW